jgi:drug/metabolite transporter (DMT)-like permease
MVDPLWIPLTIGAAFFQNVRFMLQKHLKDTGLSATGATYARFVFSAPVVGIFVLIYIQTTGVTVPPLGCAFWGFVAMAAVAQVLATVCVVALFSRRNFAVGVTLKKSEVLQTVFVGLVVLGETVSLWGLAALVIGLVALLVLSSDAIDTKALGFFRRIATPSAGLGLLSGAFFAFAGVGVRGATLELATDDLILRAGFALAMVTATQAIGMTLWFAWRDPAQIRRVARAWKPVSMVGATSLAGSYCWFAAFSLQTAAFVYALGQIEVIFSILGGALIFKERLSRKEIIGITLLMVSLVWLIFVT